MESTPISEAIAGEIGREDHSPEPSACFQALLSDRYLSWRKGCSEHGEQSGAPSPLKEQTVATRFPRIFAARTKPNHLDLPGVDRPFAHDALDVLARDVDLGYRAASRKQASVSGNYLEV